MTLCVYALTARGAAPGRGMTGIAGERLHAVASGRLAAIVGEHRRAPKPSAAALRRYDEVLQSLWRTRPALLPVRFATCFASVEELTLVLGARQDALRRALRAVRGRAQMTVRVLQPAAASRQLAPPPTTGAGFLHARARERAVEGFDPVRGAVRRWVRDERVEKRERVASVYHLVPRGSVDAYRRAVARAAGRAGLRLRVTGPFPPYAFSSPF